MTEIKIKHEMTEKEKALELIGKYQKHAMLKDFGGLWALKQ